MTAAASKTPLSPPPTRRQFALWHIFVAIFVAAYLVVAIAEPSPALAYGTMVATAAVFVLALYFTVVHPPERPFWRWFLICGIGWWLLYAFALPTPYFGRGSITWTEQAYYLYHDSGSKKWQEFYASYDQICNCLWTILMGALGGWLAMWLSPKFFPPTAGEISQKPLPTRKSRKTGPW